MRYIVKLVIIMLMSASCKAQVQQNRTVSEFHKNIKLDTTYYDKFQKEEFLNFYEKNKEEFWKKDGQRQLWKDLVPFLKGYKDPSLAQLLLKDVGLSDYSGGVLFGWQPLVTASTNSKIYHLLELIYYAEGVEGVSKYYHDRKKQILDSDKNNSPWNYSVLTGLICSLPNLEKNIEKNELSKIVIDYFTFMSSKFLRPGISSTDSSITGFKEGLLRYYFSEKLEPESKSEFYEVDAKNWPYRDKSFNIRKYYDLISHEGQKRQLSKEESDIVDKVQGIMKKVSKNK